MMNDREDFPLSYYFSKMLKYSFLKKGIPLCLNRCATGKVFMLESQKGLNLVIIFVFFRQNKFVKDVC